MAAIIRNPANNFGVSRTSVGGIIPPISDTIRKGVSLPTLVSSRHTWNEETGYNTSEFYVGGRESLWAAFNDPRFVCGAQQVIFDEDKNNETATLVIDFSHRTRSEAQRNFAQPEEFKSAWTLESQVENLEIWRDPKYAALTAAYPANSEFPLSRLIQITTEQYITLFQQAVANQVREHSTGLGGSTPLAGYQGVVIDLTQNFDVWNFLKVPNADTLLAEKRFGKTLRELGTCLSQNILKGKTTYPAFRQVVQNVSVVPNNSSFGTNIFTFKKGTINTNQLCYLILSNLYGQEATRSQTPAGCRPVSASKWSLIQGLLTSFNDVIWRPYAPTIVEITNGSFEITRSWVEQYRWEIDDCITPEQVVVDGQQNPPAQPEPNDFNFPPLD